MTGLLPGCNSQPKGPFLSDPSSLDVAAVLVGRSSIAGAEDAALLGLGKLKLITIRV